ncbi:hypothetical protein K438DRAFT_1557221, partial [Mycena galopus ATCC 62051]
RRNCCAVAEKEIPFEHVATNLARKDHEAPEFLAMNPLGLVPAIVRSLRPSRSFPSYISTTVERRMTIDSSCMKVAPFVFTWQRNM